MCPSCHKPKARTRSSAWYLLPIFFGIVGGVIMYMIVTEDENWPMVRRGLIAGGIISAISLAPLIIILILIALG